MEKELISSGYDPIELAAATEKVVVSGNRRKYVQLGRPLRFYGGTVSATEVGCNLRCKFCFSDKPVWKPGKTGRFYTPKQVFDGLTKAATKHGYKVISASASEGTLGRQHLLELLELVDETDYVYVLETNGMSLGDDPDFALTLARFENLHVRVSIKGTDAEMYHRLTGAKKESYELPFLALTNLIKAKVSCNACVMISFSEENGIKCFKERLFNLWPGLLKSLELEKIRLFPKVSRRLRNVDLIPLQCR